jgi:hypothetical protein
VREEYPRNEHCWFALSKNKMADRNSSQKESFSKNYEQIK